MMMPGEQATPRLAVEPLSCLMDGELAPDEAGKLLSSLCSSDELRQQWIAFHVVGDALRSHEVAAEHAPAFCARLSAAIAGEPTVLAPRTTAVARSPLRRFLAPGIAVAASAAVIGFVAVPLLRTSPAPAPQVATAPAPVAVAALTPAADEATARRAAATVANARALQAYVAAHRELATGVGLPRATPYLRASAEQVEGR